VVARSAGFRLPSFRSGGGASGAAAAPVEHAASARSGSIAYGSGGGVIGPGLSTDVESICVHPSRGTPAFVRNPVPRTSRISSIGVPAASRCAISTMARSPLPYTSKSAWLSTRIERRTFSDQ
jgi:hypothetical protein